MAYYRLYFFDLDSGHIAQFREFEASTEEAAIARADALRDLGAMELWSGRRKVKRWDACALIPEVRARSAVSVLRAGAQFR